MNHRLVFLLLVLAACQQPETWGNAPLGRRSAKGLYFPPPKPWLVTFETTYDATKKDARDHNITLGAKKIDGAVFEQNRSWSFNSHVGPRTLKTGFKKAPVIFMGEVLQDVGGGMCQVSSTLFGAAVTAGFDIVNRYPHSRPSSYIQRGLDATVNYPEQCWEGKQDPNVCFDLVLRSPYDSPVAVKARTVNSDKGRKLIVELWGTGQKAKVKTKWRLYKTTDYERRWRKGWKPGTWSKRKQTGESGVKGALSIDIRWPDGRHERRVIYSNYKPVDEVWWVGRDWEGGDPWE